MRAYVQDRGLPVVGVHNNHWNLLQASKACGPPAALAGNDLIITRGQLSDNDGLDNAVLLNGIGKILQSLFVKMLTRLG